MRHSKLAYNHYTRDVNPKILIIFRQQLRFRDPFTADNIKEAQKPSDRVEFSLTNLGEIGDYSEQFTVAQIKHVRVLN